MVPAERILAEARAHKVDVIGLSGLITPSLDEMMHVARELTREGFTTPLIIGPQLLLAGENNATRLHRFDGNGRLCWAISS